MSGDIVIPEATCQYLVIDLPVALLVDEGDGSLPMYIGYPVMANTVVHLGPSTFRRGPAAMALNVKHPYRMPLLVFATWSEVGLPPPAPSPYSGSRVSF